MWIPALTLALCGSIIGYWIWSGRSEKEGMWGRVMSIVAVIAAAGAALYTWAEGLFTTVPPTP